jgi:hypothetical protein
MVVLSVPASRDSRDRIIFWVGTDRRACEGGASCEAAKRSERSELNRSQIGISPSRSGWNRHRPTKHNPVTAGSRGREGRKGQCFCGKAELAATVRHTYTGNGIGIGTRMGAGKGKRMEQGKEIWTLLRSEPAERERVMRMLEEKATPTLRAGGQAAQEMFMFMNDTYIGKDDPELTEEFNARLFELLPEYDKQAIFGVMLTRTMEDAVREREVLEHNAKPWWKRGLRRSFQR